MDTEVVVVILGGYMHEVSTTPTSYLLTCRDVVSAAPLYLEMETVGMVTATAIAAVVAVEETAMYEETATVMATEDMDTAVDMVTAAVVMTAAVVVDLET